MARASAIAKTFRAFRDGDAAAMREVRGWVESVVRGGRWRFDDDEAVTQDALIALYRIVQEDRVSDPGAFLKFAQTVAKRTCVNQYYTDRRRRERESGVEIEAEAPEQRVDFLERQQQHRALAYIVQQLSDDCRTLWEQVYCEQREQKGIATEMGITVNNLRVRIHRCLEHARGAYRRFMRFEPAS